MNGAPIIQENGVKSGHKVKPPIPAKPGQIKPVKPPPVKRKPLLKSQSVDSYSIQKRAELDLTQVGDSEWRDFVSRRNVEVEGAEDQVLTPAIKSLNLERKSSVGVEQTIVEVVEPKEIITNHEQTNNVTTGPCTTNNGPCRSEEIRPPVVSPQPAVPPEVLKETHPCQLKPHVPKINNKEVPDTTNDDCKKINETALVNNVAVVNNDSTKTDTAPPPANTGPPPPTAITLPKPRQIVSEIKRSEHKRSAFAASRSMSLPSTQLAPQIKRSSDILREASAKTPYFCRQSRGSVDLLEPISDLKEATSE